MPCPLDRVDALAVGRLSVVCSIVKKQVWEHQCLEQHESMLVLVH